MSEGKGGASLKVSTANELIAALANESIRHILVIDSIADLPTLRLASGQQLIGANNGATLVFADGADGIQLSQDNYVANLRIEVDPRQKAIFNDTTVDTLGTVQLAEVTAVGQVEIVTRDRVRAGHVIVDGLDIVAADLRDRTQRPELLGVGVLQGAFTLWNLQPDEHAVITADLRRISAGREDAGVRGSGVFVAGASNTGGRLEVSVLETGPIFTESGIAEGTHDTISGGVFVVYGAHVSQVHNRGPVTTYGVNGMVLDNWGVVDTWIVHEPLTSHGPSGVGFVNFGVITTLRVNAPIETYGVGSRGFNVYRLDEFVGPTVETVEFERITTHADAAIGIQIGQPIGRLVVRDGIHTSGGAGDSLVRGVITRLAAHALSVQPGGHVDSVDVGGALSSSGPGIVALDVRGQVDAMSVRGGIRASGAGSDGLNVDGGSLRLNDTEVIAEDGIAIRLTASSEVELRGVHARGNIADVKVEPAKD